MEERHAGHLRDRTDFSRLERLGSRRRSLRHLVNRLLFRGAVEGACLACAIAASWTSAGGGTASATTPPTSASERDGTASGCGAGTTSIGMGFEIDPSSDSG